MNRGELLEQIQKKTNRGKPFYRHECSAEQGYNEILDQLSDLVEAGLIRYQSENVAGYEESGYWALPRTADL
jgi:hypothetical protein